MAAYNRNFVTINESQQNLQNFNCGVNYIDRFIVNDAADHMSLGISNTYVLPINDSNIVPGKTGKADIASFYTMSRQMVLPTRLPSPAGYPSYPVTVFYIALIGVDKKHQRKNIGSKTLITAIRNAVSISSRPDSVGVGIVLDVANSSKARKFYSSFDFFIPMEGDTNRLYVGMDDVKDL